MLRRLLNEPLAHFLALAAAIFVAYGVLNPSEPRRPDRVVVSQLKIAQLANVFAMSMQRPPTADEFKGLIDDYIKEEIYFREALALGLDKEDMFIRRRLRLRMELLSQLEAEGLVATDAELSEYLQANPRVFAIEPLIAFRHVYLNPERRGSTIDQDAASVLAALREGATADPDMHGDATLMPSELPMTAKSSIGRMFGPEFADKLDEVATERWSGPIRSAFGVHIVRITQRVPGRVPVLNEVRNAVAREWANAKRHAIERDRYERLRQRYQIDVEPYPDVKTVR